MAAATPTRQQCQDNFESAVAMTLQLWHPLSFAVENNLGGGDGADKRDWFAGAVAELYEDSWSNVLVSGPIASTITEDYLMDTESRLLQIMEDEFGTVVDDGTPFDIANEIVGLWANCRRGQFDSCAALRQRWEASRGKSVRSQFQAGKAPDDDTAWSTDDDDEDDDEEEDDEDTNMDEAPGLVEAQQTREKPQPEVDEDGFTTVSRKKR